jgi:hypothetical protein
VFEGWVGVCRGVWADVCVFKRVIGHKIKHKT